MGIYKQCPHCGANLDPGERCDCGEQKERTASPTKESCSISKHVALTATVSHIITE